MTGSIKDVTPNFKFIIPQFNVATWHDYIETNFRNIDALINQIYVVTNYKGAWETNTVYNKNDVVFIATDKEDSEYISNLFKIVNDGGVNTTGYEYFSDMYEEHPEYYEKYLTVSDVVEYAEEAQEAAESANEAVETITEALSGLSASKAIVTDSDKNLASSATTSTQIGYLSTLTSNVQTQLNGKAGLSAYNNFTNGNAFTGNVRIQGENTLRKQSATLDTSGTPVDAINQIVYTDKDDHGYIFLQGNQTDDGIITFAISGKAKYTNTVKTPFSCRFFTNNSTPAEALVNTPSNNLEKSQLIANTAWVHNFFPEKNKLYSGGRVSLSISLKTSYKITNDGILFLSIRTNGRQSSNPTLVQIHLSDTSTATSSSNLVANIGSYHSSSSENSIIPIAFPVLKNQSIYIDHNVSSGTVSDYVAISSAYLFKYAG